MERTESTCLALLTFFLSSPRVSVWRFVFNFVFYLSSSFLDKKPGSSCADSNSLKCHPSFAPPSNGRYQTLCARWVVGRRDGWHFRPRHKNHRGFCSHRGRWLRRCLWAKLRRADLESGSSYIDTFLCHSLAQCKQVSIPGVLYY